MATVTSQLTRIHDVEGALTLTSITGGAGGAANTEIIIQGAQSAGRKQSNATDHGFWLQVTSADVSGTLVHIGIWINHIHYAVLTKLATRFGSDTSNYHEHSYPLSTYPATGGWIRVWVNVARTADATSGSFNKAAMTQIAVLASLPAVAGNAPNLIMDASDFTTSGLLLTGVSGVFSDFVTADEGSSTNKYGVVLTRSGIIYCLARLALGSASSLVFSDSNFVIVFPDQSLVASNFMGASVDLQNASTNIDWTDGVVKSAGTTKGDLVVSGATGTFDVTGCTLSNLRVITLTSGCTLASSAIAGCGAITQSGATISSCTVSGSTVGDGAAAIVSNNPSLISNCAFTFNDGHALEITTPGTYTFTGNTFSGYGANGTNDAAIYNNSGGLVTLNIAGGGDTPTVRNGGGASTTINNTVTLEVNGVKTGAEPTNYVRVRIEAASGGPETAGAQLMNKEAQTSAGGGYYKATEQYNFLGNQPVVIRARFKGYLPFEASGTITANGLTVTAVWQLDPNFT